MTVLLYIATPGRVLLGFGRGPKPRRSNPPFFGHHREFTQGRATRRSFPAFAFIILMLPFYLIPLSRNIDDTFITHTFDTYLKVGGSRP